MTTIPEAQRDELAHTLMDASAQAWEKDGSRHWPNMAETVLAADYRKCRTITAAEELDALHARAIVRDSFNGVVHEKCIDFQTGKEFWVCPGEIDEHTAGKIALPATVLWEPEA